MDNSIRSVADAVDIITKPLNFSDIGIRHDMKYPFGLWFRGQANAEWDLEPHVFRRTENGKSMTYDETSMFINFQLRLPEYQHQYKSNFDWLCLMQHYGLPTRLLDWTENIFVALFFAVKDNYDTVDKDAKLFALNAKRLNKISIISETGQESVVTPNALDAQLRSSLAKYIHYDSVLSDDRIAYHNIDKKRLDKLKECVKNNVRSELAERIRYPVAVFPNRLNARMIQQCSVFTLHGGKLYLYEPKGSHIPDPIKFEKLNENTDNKILKQYVIPKNKKKEINDHLRYLGIHEGSLFPDLENQSNFLKQQWTAFHDMRDNKKFYVNE